MRRIIGIIVRAAAMLFVGVLVVRHIILHSTDEEIWGRISTLLFTFAVLLMITILLRLKGV